MSYPIFLSFELRIDAFQKPAEFFNVPFRNKFDPSVIFYNLHFLTDAKVQRLPHCFGYNNLIFWRYGYSLACQNLHRSYLVLQ